MGKSGNAATAQHLTRWPPPLRAGLSLAAGLLVLGAVALLAADGIAEVLRHVIAASAAMLLAAPLTPEHVVLASVQNVPVYELRAVVETPWSFTNHTIPVDSAVQVTVPRAHSLYHLVIIGAVIVAFPVSGRRQLLVRVAVGVGAVALAVALDAPFVLAAEAHALFYEQFAPARLESSPTIAVARFLDHGGRLVLAGLLGIATVAVSRR